MDLNGSLLHMLRRASQASDSLFGLESRDGALTARQFAILAAIGGNEGATQSVLVEATGIDRSTLSEVMNRLEAKGFLTRRRSAADARAYMVHLTAKGAEALEAGRKAAENVDKLLVEVTGGPAASDLLRMLNLIAASSQQASAKKQG